MSESETDFWSEQWTVLLGMTAAAITAADSVMDAMRGDLGGIKDRDEAAREIARRIGRWTDARKEIISYAKAAEADLAVVASRNGVGG